MTDAAQLILARVRSHLGAGRADGAIVYLDRTLRRAGDSIQAGDRRIDLPWDAYAAFVDLEPKANWGHACCYLAIRTDGEEIVEQAAQMPPFLKAEGSPFRFLWRGARAPQWAIAVERDARE